MGRFGEVRSRMCNVYLAHSIELEQNLSQRKEAEADASYSPWDLLQY